MSVKLAFHQISSISTAFCLGAIPPIRAADLASLAQNASDRQVFFSKLGDRPIELQPDDASANNINDQESRVQASSFRRKSFWEKSELLTKTPCSPDSEFVAAFNKNHHNLGLIGENTGRFQDALAARSYAPRIPNRETKSSTTN